MTLRKSRRVAMLAWALTRGMLRYWLLRARGRVDAGQRALWLQATCRDVLRSVSVTYRVTGTPATSGLVVSNHLSYLDIVVYSAAMPCVFVAKAEVRHWAYFGAAARASGTVFLDRGSRAAAAAASQEIGERLRHPVPVLLFPEGTSTDGGEVLKFHPALFQPAMDAGAPVTAAAIRYRTDGGAAERDVCWFDEVEFLPHLWKLLDIAPFTAAIEFGAGEVYADRRIAAASTHEAIAAMRAERMSNAVDAWMLAAAP